MNRKLFKYSVDLFISTLEQVTHQKKHKISCNDADTAAFKNFIERYGSNVGEEFILKFEEFAFSQWFKKDSEIDYGKTIRFAWIFSKRMMDLWDKNSIGFNVYKTRKSSFKKDFKVNNARTSSNFKEFCNSLIEQEENNKAVYLNTKRGLAFCIATTKLFFHKSSNCVICMYKNECREILKNEYPKIYKIRGYGE